MDNKDTKSSTEVVIQPVLVNEKSDGLKYLTTHFSSPRVAIGRKEFFVGGITIWLSVLLLGALAHFLFEDNTQLVFIVTALLYTYLSATWFTKRFLDIRPSVNVEPVQVVLFFLFIALSILTYVQTGMLAEFRAFSDYIIANGIGSEGAPVISASALSYGVPVSFARATIGITLSAVALFLLFKRGARLHAEQSIEIKIRDTE